MIYKRDYTFNHTLDKTRMFLNIIFFKLVMIYKHDYTCNININTHNVS